MSNDTPTTPPASSNSPNSLDLPYDYRRNVVLDLVLTVLLCGLWNLVVQYHQIETLNALLKQQKYSFLKLMLFSLLTCGAYYVYHQYLKAKDFLTVMNQPSDTDPALAAALAVFGLNFIYDAILQNKINEFLNRFPN